MKQPELKSKTNEFWTYLNTRTKFAKGWDVEVVKNQATKIRFTCLHGRRYEEDMLILGEYDLPKTMASQTFHRALRWCKGEHVDITPNAWISGYTMQPQPLVPSWKPVYMTGTVVFNSTPGFITYTSALGGHGSILGELSKVFPALNTVVRLCPACSPQGLSSGPLSSLIPHINDYHRWSREKIADWLDVISLGNPDIDLTIQPKEKRREQPSIGPSAEEFIAKYYGTATLDGSSITKK